MVSAWECIYINPKQSTVSRNVGLEGLEAGCRRYQDPGPQADKKENFCKPGSLRTGRPSRRFLYTSTKQSQCTERVVEARMSQIVNVD